MTDPENLETEQGQSVSAQKKFEAKEEHLIKAVELLENPQDQSFLLGLQAFIAWVKNLVANKD